MITSKKIRKLLLSYARKEMNLPKVNACLTEERLPVIHKQEWDLWTNYYLNIVNTDPYMEYELITNNRSLAWFAEEYNRRKTKITIS